MNIRKTHRLKMPINTKTHYFNLRSRRNRS
jgi:hypothetical protein